MVSDGRPIGPIMADGVLFVVRAGADIDRSRHPASAEQLELLGIPIIGAVLVAGDAAPTSSRFAAPGFGRKARI